MLLSRIYKLIFEELRVNNISDDPRKIHIKTILNNFMSDSR